MPASGLRSTRSCASACPTHFSATPRTSQHPPNSDDNNTQLLAPVDQGPVNHRIAIETVRGYILDYVGHDLTTPLEPADWLTFPMQKLRTLTAGAVDDDAIGLQEVRARFAFYPHRTCGSTCWLRAGRASEESISMGRAGSAGDEVGAALSCCTLGARDVMRLCFLMERQYPPYAKWFGTAAPPACLCRASAARTGADVTGGDVARARARASSCLRGAGAHAQRLATHRAAGGDSHALSRAAVPGHGDARSCRRPVLARICDPALRRIAALPPITTCSRTTRTCWRTRSGVRRCASCTA